MKTKQLTQTALYIALALIIHVLEGLLPGLIPVPGVKPGLANIITLLAAYRLGARRACIVVFARVLLGCMFGGSLSALIYSAAGSLLALGVILPLSRVIQPGYMYILSILSACAHNLGQILVAALITRTPGLLMYLPVLLLSAWVSGLFTGLCAAFLNARLEKYAVKTGGK